MGLSMTARNVPNLRWLVQPLSGHARTTDARFLSQSTKLRTCSGASCNEEMFEKQTGMQQILAHRVKGEYCFLPLYPTAVPWNSGKAVLVLTG
jgi:hypothetical protein